MPHVDQVPIAIVGMGGMFPDAPTLDAYWQLILHGRDAISTVPSHRWGLAKRHTHESMQGAIDHVYHSLGCYLPDLPPANSLGAIDAERIASLDPSARLALEVGVKTWQQVATSQLDPKRIGIILGHVVLPTESTRSLALDWSHEQKELCENSTSAQRYAPPAPINREAASLPATILGKALAFQGPCLTLDAACASSLYAIHCSVRALQQGKLDAVLTGGLSRPDCLYTQMGFTQLRALSRSGCAKPFDAHADGLIVGEGAGMVVLKRLPDALAAGDAIFGVIRAVGVSNDRAGKLLAPSSEGQLRAMRSAYVQAGWTMQDVDFIECHATGTPIGDAVELQSMLALWKELVNPLQPIRKIALGSVKANIGHTLSAAGAAGLLKVLLAMRENILPPQPNFHQIASEIPFHDSAFHILRQPLPWVTSAGKPRRAAISAFGFGGINAHLLLEEWRAEGDAFVSTKRQPTVTVHWQANADDSVVVVGMSAQLGDQPGLRSFWQRHVAKPSNWQISEIEVPLDHFRIPPQEIEEMLPQQLWPLLHARQALLRSDLLNVDHTRTGVFLGLELDLNTTRFCCRWAERSDGIRRDAISPPLTANRTMGALGSVAASRIAREWRCGGPSFTFSSGQDAGLEALTCALQFLQSQEIDRAIVGVVDLAADELARTWSDMDQPTPRSWGDAVVMIVLEREESARERNAPIVAQLQSTVHKHQRTNTESHSQLSFETIDQATGKILRQHRISPPTGTCFGAAHGLVTLASGLDAMQQGYWPAHQAQSKVQPWMVQRNKELRSIVLQHQTQLGHEMIWRLCEVNDAADQVDSEWQPIPWPWTAVPVLGSSLAELQQHIQVLINQFNSTDQPHDIIRSWIRRSLVQNQAPLACVFLWPKELTKSEHVELLYLAQQALDRNDQLPRLDLKWSTVHGTAHFFAQMEPLGPQPLAFVYPGSGNCYHTLGMDLLSKWPKLLKRLEKSFPNLSRWLHMPTKDSHESYEQETTLTMISKQVLFGLVMQSCLDDMGIEPQAVIGYSLGESIALLAHRIWPRDETILQRLAASSLFQSDLTGPCHAARAAWRWPEEKPLHWQTVIIPCSADLAEHVLQDEPFAHLMIINSDQEVVIGGAAEAVAKVVQKLGKPAWPIQGASAVHGSFAQPVADAYRALHDLPVKPPVSLRVYSGANRDVYQWTTEQVAESILQLALKPLHFPRLLQKACQDGVRHFVDIGPGNSCFRMMQQVLDQQKVRLYEANTGKPAELEGIQLLCARLFVERVPMAAHRLFGFADCQSAARDNTLSIPAHRPMKIPPLLVASEMSSTDASGEHATMLQQLLKMQSAKARAHEKFLEWMDRWNRVYAAAIQSIPNHAEHVSLFVDTPSKVVTEPDISFIKHEQADPPRQLNREQCLEFARGRIAPVFGSAYAAIDRHPTRVRLPDEPLMLVDRVHCIEGKPLSLTSGRIVTEHVIHPDRWYLDAGRIPTCIAVEAGQADLMLSGFLGIDQQTKGLAVYRLLDAEVTFHAHLPSVGQTVQYDIQIERFFQQSQTYLFRFAFEGTVQGKLLLTMKHGCAGFFTHDALQSGKGLVQTDLDKRPLPRKRPDDWISWVPMKEEVYSDEQVNALRQGDLAHCFGASFAYQSLARVLWLPSKPMHLIDRITELHPNGGRYQLGFIRGELDIHPEDWFLVCHFVDDPVMPGTLMYECCSHTLRVFLLRMGWITSNEAAFYTPKIGVASRLKCRGQVIPSTRKAQFAIHIKELGYDPAPFALADAILYADDKPIVEIADMSLSLQGVTQDDLRRTWHTMADPLPHGSSLISQTRQANRPALFDHDRILAFAVGKPSAAFGEPYRIFDSERVIARLPGPPYQFLDRIVHIDAEPWRVQAGGNIEAEYDVPSNAWYFTAQRQQSMPFAVLLEIALQPCGWLAAYLGSALTSKEDLSFRNLGGQATLYQKVMPDTGTLRTRVRITRVAQSLGMLIQHYDFSVHSRTGVVYEGNTYFGFFTKQALNQQVGLSHAKLYLPSQLEENTYQAIRTKQLQHWPQPPLSMLDEVRLFATDSAGSYGKGFISGTKHIDKNEWFFKAHFYQDPVWPGSLGLEAFLQLLRAYAAERWSLPAEVEIGLPLSGSKHQWVYRGQVLPTHRLVQVEASIKQIDDEQQTFSADGWLTVDGLTIYQMQDFAVGIESIKSTAR